MPQMTINNMDGSCNTGVTRDYDKEMIKIQLGHLLYVNKGNIVVARYYNVLCSFVKTIMGSKSNIPNIY